MRSSATRTLVAREGWPLIILAFVVAAAVQKIYGLEWSLVLWIIAAILIYMFRDPERAIPAVPLAVICPVDGRVTSIDRVRDPYLERDALRIAIRMNLTGSYTARSPTEGKVMERWFPQVTKQQEDNEKLDENACKGVRYAQWIRTDENDDFVLCVEGGTNIVRPSCFVQSGERIGQGHRCGYIPFGAKIDVMIPANARVDIKVGDRVTAGTDIIASLVHD